MAIQRKPLICMWVGEGSEILIYGTNLPHLARKLNIGGIVGYAANDLYPPFCALGINLGKFFGQKVSRFTLSNLLKKCKQ